MHKNGGFLSSLQNALNGLKSCVCSEKNAKVHLVATILVIVTASILHLSLMNWLFVLLAISMVWITELFNTAIEFMFDVSKPEIDPRVKYAKDISSAAVLVAALFSLIVGIIILFPPILQILTKVFS